MYLHFRRGGLFFLGSHLFGWGLDKPTVRGRNFITSFCCGRSVGKVPWTFWGKNGWFGVHHALVACESKSAGGFSLIACHVMEMLKQMQGWLVHASMIRHNRDHIPTIMIAMVMVKPRNYKNRIICYFRLPETNSSHQKIDPWKRSVPYWKPSFLGAKCEF